MSGIVRKVDELGRIVIPKELRKNLNIKNSDDLSISIENNRIVLEKFYRLKNSKEILKTYFNVLNRFLSSKFIVTDKENILLTSEINNDIIDNKLLHNYIELIYSRKQCLETGTLKIVKDYDVNGNYYFNPLIVNTDVLGSILIYSDKKISERDVVTVEIVMFLLKEKLE